MNSDVNLVTSYNFRGREYLINLRTVKQSELLEVKVTDKKTAEEWLGAYNASYIENLTHKTGNYKRFDTFVSMLKSGVLTTSHCLTLDLLKYEDLEMLRSRSSQTRGFNIHNSQILGSSTNNRRYLIVTYTVEFDRIHYPLALEYCGPPDPRVLQETIQRLEKQVTDLQIQLDSNDWSHIKNEMDALQRKVVDITTENIMLKKEINKLTTLQRNKDCNKEIDTLLKYTYTLENKLQFERNSLEKLQKENFRLSSRLNEALKTENLWRDGFNRSPLIVDGIKSKEQRAATKNFSAASPKRNLYTVSCAEKPFSRHRPLSRERKINSARSRINVNNSSSEESVVGGNGRYRVGALTSLQSRASSPSFSDLSHNSDISRCACRNCLHRKFIRKEDQSLNSKTKDKGRGRAKLLRRIQSLEKLISGIVLN